MLELSILWFLIVHCIQYLVNTHIFVFHLLEEFHYPCIHLFINFFEIITFFEEFRCVMGRNCDSMIWYTNYLILICSLVIIWLLIISMNHLRRLFIVIRFYLLLLTIVFIVLCLNPWTRLHLLRHNLRCRLLLLNRLPFLNFIVLMFFMLLLGLLLYYVVFLIGLRNIRWNVLWL